MKKPDQWQESILTELRAQGFQEQETIDQAKEKLAAGLVGLALILLLGAIIGGGR